MSAQKSAKEIQKTEALEEDLQYLKLYRRQTPRGYKTVCRRVMQEAKALNRMDAYGAACYYMADYLYGFGKPIAHYLRQAITNLLDSGDDVLIARTYNLLGIEAFNHGVDEASLDYLVRACSYADALHDDEIAAVIYLNMGAQYNCMGNFPDGKKYCHRAAAAARKLPPENMYHTQIQFWALVEECNASIQKDNTHDAGTLLHRAHIMLAEMSQEERAEYANYSLYLIVLCEYHLLQGNDSEFKQTLEKVYELLKDKDMVIDGALDLIRFGDFLLQHSHADAVKKIVDVMWDTVGETNITNLKLRFYRMAVNYYQAITKPTRELEASRLYFDAYNKHRTEELSDYQTFLSTYQAMEQAKKENERLARLAHYDALTGLQNRSIMRRRIDAIFEEAYQLHQFMAVEILDIDNFKHFNDTYGHTTGDRCLVALAKVLSDVSGDHVEVFRYGGDEFVVLYHGLSEMDVLNVADQLQKGIRNATIKTETASVISGLTISQGICGFVPSGGNKNWDLLYAADIALYSVKNSQKGGIRLTHGLAFTDLARNGMKD